jgi:dihydropteroate synthase
LRLVLDPGIGFGKTDEHNLDLLRAIPVLETAGRPILIGASRKSFMGRLLGREVGDRLAGSLAVVLDAARRGALAVRVHDVKETCDALDVRVIVEQDEYRRRTT